MLTKASTFIQKNLFYGCLLDMLDCNDPLIKLADEIQWSIFEKEFKKYYSHEGHFAKPIRLMVGLLFLKQLENLSDESLVFQWKRNPYYQYFCGRSDYVASLPCDSVEKLKLRRTYVREIKQHRLNLRFFKHPKKIKKARASIKRLRTIVGILIRDISRNLDSKVVLKYEKKFELFDRVRNQKIKDKNKILSLHETHVYAITKGKEHKRYEYGIKASNIIVGVASHDKNIHDLKTLEAALSFSNKNRVRVIKEAICDRWDRGVKEELKKICIPSSELKTNTKKEKQMKKKKFKRNSAIEPIIGHLKSDYRLSRNYLKGFIGDEINLLLAATAWNLKKWMKIYFYSIFIGEIKLIKEY